MTSPAQDDAAAGTVSATVASLTDRCRELQKTLKRGLRGKVFEQFEAPRTISEAYTEAQAFQQALVDETTGKKRKIEEDAATKRWAMKAGESRIDENHAPFLAFNEEHFRHITAIDVANLVLEGPSKPEDDVDFRVPEMGKKPYWEGATPRRRSDLKTKRVRFDSSAAVAFSRPVLRIRPLSRPLAPRRLLADFVRSPEPTDRLRQRGRKRTSSSASESSRGGSRKRGRRGRNRRRRRRKSQRKNQRRSRRRRSSRSRSDR